MSTSRKFVGRNAEWDFVMQSRLVVVRCLVRIRWFSSVPTTGQIPPSVQNRVLSDSYHLTPPESQILTTGFPFPSMTLR